MFDLIRKIWRTKTVTKTSLLEEAPSRFHGKPVFVSCECTGCHLCVDTCPTGAVNFHKTGDSINLSISYSSCIFCGTCAEHCETKMILTTNEYRLATKNKDDLTTTVNLSTKEPTLLPTGKGV